MVTGNEFMVNGGIMAVAAARPAGRVGRIAGTTSRAAPAPVASDVTWRSSAQRCCRRRVGLPARRTRGRSRRGEPRPDGTDEAAVRSWLGGLGPWRDRLRDAAGPGRRSFTQGPPEWEDELAADFRVPWVLAHGRGDLQAGAAVTFVADSAGRRVLLFARVLVPPRRLAYSTDDLADRLRLKASAINTMSRRPRVDAQRIPGGPASKEDIAASPSRHARLRADRVATQSGDQPPLRPPDALMAGPARW